MSDVDDPRILHTGEAKVMVGLTVAQIEEILRQIPGPTLIAHLLHALRLLDAELATAYAKAYGLVI